MPSSTPDPGVTSAPFGSLPDGATVERFTLTNATGATAQVMTYGAALTSLRVPDRDGRLGEVVLGFDALAPYLAHDAYFGATVGRVANRIAHGRFTLDGDPHALATNDGPHHLHGGQRGFDKRLWQAEIVSQRPAAVRFSRVSADGEEGYPGALTVSVVFTWTDRNELLLDYEARPDRPTPVNLTNHSYFNLRGLGDILDHRLLLDADFYTPVDATLIPTGEIAPVAHTPFDFTQATELGPRIRQTGGFDHNFVKRDPDFARVARLVDPDSGRVLELFTTEPGVQFYSGNFLDGSLVGHSGRVYAQYAGLCLEAQHFPNAPNQPAFPSIVLRPGETYRQHTRYAFSVDP